MMKILNYLLSAIYALYFFTCIFIFHPIQVIIFNLFGRKAHKKTVYALNFFLLRGMHLTGASINFYDKGGTKPKTPLIIISNHESMYDITGIYWFLRSYEPVFVSKIELSKKIPSISYNLRVSGAALIKRKDKVQALEAISNLGKLIEQEKESAVIFPEGTRTRRGMKEFQLGGVTTLLKSAPNAKILPVAIKGTGKMDAYKVYPLNSFVKLSWTVLPVVDPKGREPAEVLDEVRTLIKNEIGE